MNEFDRSLMAPLQREMRRYQMERNIKRPQIATRANRIAIEIWGDDAPIVSDADVRWVDSQGTRPGDGRIMRTIVAAHDIRLVDAYEMIGYWPDLRATKALSDGTMGMNAVKAALDMAGVEASVRSCGDGRVMVTFNKEPRS
jgi:hypothetical protein